jgi:hypothetical protein
MHFRGDIMIKIITFLLLTLPFTGYARDAHETIYMYLGELDRKVAALKDELAAIHNELTSLQVAPKKIGDEYRGGLVFFVDESGQHGLIASKIDVNDKGIQWRNGAAGNKITNARGDGIGAGETNTRLIIAQQTIDNQNGQFAALMAANFQVLGDGVTPCKTPVASESICYGGWYLPSAYELQLLHSNLHQPNLSSFAPEFYWSSTEASVSNAWLQNFSTGEIMTSSKANTIGRVRAISHF